MQLTAFGVAVQDGSAYIPVQAGGSEVWVFARQVFGRARGKAVKPLKRAARDRVSRRGQGCVFNGDASYDAAQPGRCFPRLLSAGDRGD